jgi:hypothetical protein
MRALAADADTVRFLLEQSGYESLEHAKRNLLMRCVHARPHRPPSLLGALAHVQTWCWGGGISIQGDSIPTRSPRPRQPTSPVGLGQAACRGAPSPLTGHLRMAGVHAWQTSLHPMTQFDKVRRLM